MDKDIKIRMHALRLMKQQEIIELDIVDKEPRPGEQVRYNCHLHIEEDGENA